MVHNKVIASGLRLFPDSRLQRFIDKLAQSDTRTPFQKILHHHLFVLLIMIQLKADPINLLSFMATALIRLPLLRNKYKTDDQP